MAAGVVNRTLVAIGVTAVVLCGVNVPTGAWSQQGQQQQANQKEKEQQKAKKTQDQDKQRAQKKKEQEQQRLIGRQEQRLAQYRDHLEQQQRVAREHSAHLQQQNRRAQYGYQQQYVEGLRQQQWRIQIHGSYDYGRDPYFYTAPSYRYFRGGRYHETNQYGVNLLRQSVNAGYQQGRLAGLADRQDRWPFGYRDSYAYQDANYGYGGFYVDRDDYNNYFREGFRRGYEDGYYERHQYGTHADGSTSILGAELGVILNIEPIR